MVDVTVVCDCGETLDEIGANLDMNAQIIALLAENKRLKNFIEEYEYCTDIYRYGQVMANVSTQK